MTTKEATALRLNVDLLNAMRRVKNVEGIPVTTQIEMAVREWLKKRGVALNSSRRRGDSRARQ